MDAASPWVIQNNGDICRNKLLLGIRCNNLHDCLICSSIRFSGSNTNADNDRSPNHSNSKPNSNLNTNKRTTTNSTSTDGHNNSGENEILLVLCRPMNGVGGCFLELVLL